MADENRTDLTSSIHTASPNGETGNYTFDHPGIATSRTREIPEQHVKQDIITDYIPVIPPVETFAGKYFAVNKTYYNYFDEALHDSLENTLAMRRDPFIHELLRHRQIPVSILPHNIEVDDPDDPEQESVGKVIDGLYSNIKQLKGMKIALLEAIFYGKAAVQIQIGPKNFSGNRYNSIVNNIPINGDKLRYKWDGTPGIAIRTGAQESNERLNDWLDHYKDYVENTTLGQALFLKDDYLRDRFVIHEFEPSDTDYLFEIDMAQSIHGLGLRSRLYWGWNLRTEIFSWMQDALQRVGANGMLYAFCKEGDPNSQKAVLDALISLVKDNVSVFPMPGGPDKNYRDIIQRIEPSPIGYDIMFQLVQYLDDIMRRAVLGQNLSSKSEPLGIGSGAAGLQGMTYESMIKYDAVDLGETQNDQMLKVLLKYNKFQYRGKIYRGVDLPFSLRLSYNFKSTDSERIMQAARSLYDMGVPMDEDELRKEAGFTKPRNKSTIIMNPQIEQAKEQAKQAASPLGQAQNALGGIGKAIDSKTKHQQSPGVHAGNEAGLQGMRHSEKAPPAAKLPNPPQAKAPQHTSRFARAGDPDDCGHEKNSGEFTSKNTCASGINLAKNDNVDAYKFVMKEWKRGTGKDSWINKAHDDLDYAKRFKASIYRGEKLLEQDKDIGKDFIVTLKAIVNSTIKSHEKRIADGDESNDKEKRYLHTSGDKEIDSIAFADTENAINDIPGFSHAVDSYQAGVFPGKKSPMDNLYESSDYSKVKSAFNQTRKYLKDNYGDQVRLYRSEDINLGVPGKPLSAYAMSQYTARKFAYNSKQRRLISQEIPIDAIWAVVRTHDRPLELLVDNEAINGIEKKYIKMKKREYIDKYSRAGDPDDCGHERQGGEFTEGNTCAGESSEDNDYKGSHRPVTVEGGGAPLHDLEPIFGSDIYGKNAAQYYGTGDDRLDKRTLDILKSIKGKPDAEVPIYRAVPRNSKYTGINSGDWVTINKDYAIAHGESSLNGEYELISKNVKAKDLVTSLDSFHEQGYYPSASSEEKGISNLKRSMLSEYPGIDLSLYESDHKIELETIKVPKQSRGQGIGSEVIRKIQSYAASVNKPIVIRPEAEKGKKGALQSFYKSLGFVNNKGKNIDYSLSSPVASTMYWKPKKEKFDGPIPAPMAAMGGIMNNPAPPPPTPPGSPPTLFSGSSEIDRYTKAGDSDDCGHEKKGGEFTKGNICSSNIFYHSTSKSSARDLEENGIDDDMLNRRDSGFFGPGFYASVKPQDFYGKSIVEISLKPGSKVLNVGELVPDRSMEFQDDLNKYIKASILKRRPDFPDDRINEIISEVTPGSKNFDHLEYKNYISGYARNNGYDAVSFSNGQETVIINKNAIDKIKHVGGLSSANKRYLSRFSRDSKDCGHESSGLFAHGNTCAASGSPNHGKSQKLYKPSGKLYPGKQSETSGKPEQKSGKLVKPALDKAVKAADKANKKIHDAADAVMDDLPPTLAKALKTLKKTYFSTFEAAEHAAHLLSRSNGMGPEASKKFSRILTAVDLAGFKASTAAAEASGLGILGATAAGFIPLASSLYLLHSMTKNPLKTIAAARKAVKRTMRRIRDISRHAMQKENWPLVLLASGNIDKYGDSYRALLYAALDEYRGDLGKAIYISNIIHRKGVKK